MGSFASRDKIPTKPGQLHPVDGKPHLSVIFYNELKPWFDLAEPLAFSFKGVKYYDVITNKADLSSVKHLLY